MTKGGGCKETKAAMGKYCVVSRVRENSLIPKSAFPNEMVEKKSGKKDKENWKKENWKKIG